MSVGIKCFRCEKEIKDGEVAVVLQASYLGKVKGDILVDTTNVNFGGIECLSKYACGKCSDLYFSQTGVPYLTSDELLKEGMVKG